MEGSRPFAVARTGPTFHTWSNVGWGTWSFATQNTHPLPSNSVGPNVTHHKAKVLALGCFHWTGVAALCVSASRVSCTGGPPDRVRLQSHISRAPRLSWASGQCTQTLCGTGRPPGAQLVAAAADGPHGCPDSHNAPRDSGPRYTLHRSANCRSPVALRRRRPCRTLPAQGCARDLRHRAAQDQGATPQPTPHTYGERCHGLPQCNAARVGSTLASRSLGILLTFCMISQAPDALDAPDAPDALWVIFLVLVRLRSAPGWRASRHGTTRHAPAILVWSHRGGR